MSMTETGLAARPTVALTPSVRTHGLITVGGMRALTGCGYDEIFARVDGGDLVLKPLVWVFDFASTWPANDKRDLRLWRTEVLGEHPAVPVTLAGLARVLEMILPTRRTTFPAGEVLELFCLTRPALKALRPHMAGVLVTGGSSYSRAGLAEFLTTRWLNQPILKS